MLSSELSESVNKDSADFGFPVAGNDTFRAS